MSGKFFQARDNLNLTKCNQVFEMGPHLWVGLPGLATDIQTVHQKIEVKSDTLAFYILFILLSPPVPAEHVRAEGEQEDEAQDVR